MRFMKPEIRSLGAGEDIPTVPPERLTEPIADFFVTDRQIALPFGVGRIARSQVAGQKPSSKAAT
jgi:hypothetical protein